MPNNLHLPVLSPLPVPKPKKIERIVDEAEETVRDLAAHVHTTAPRREGTGPFGRLFGISQRAFAGRFEARAFRGFEADETCTRCGWCVRHCPVDNIALTDDAVEFADRCVLCMRCYSFCPEDAIQSGDKTRDAEKYRRYKGPEGRPYRGG
jgi:ferredoxin